ncbi:MAG TPA: hypothetical protein VKT73_06405 [Xanthobacteraceae bacterium]|nr:hypothetical protein [Xanthobacteraceae bacterium]
MSDGKTKPSQQPAVDALAIDAPTCPALPLVDDETLEAFLNAPERVGLLPVAPTGFRREFQRLIVSAYLRDTANSGSLST